MHRPWEFEILYSTQRGMGIVGKRAEEMGLEVWTGIAIMHFIVSLAGNT